MTLNHLNDLECPIHVKVCLVDGTLDVHVVTFRADNA